MADLKGCGLSSQYGPKYHSISCIFLGIFRKNNVITSLEGLAPPSTQNPDSTPDDVQFILKSVQKLECIPLRCVPSAAVVVCWQGGVFQEVSAQGVSAKGCLLGGVCPGGVCPGMGI